MNLFKNRDFASFFGLSSQDDEYDEHIFEDEESEEEVLVDPVAESRDQGEQLRTTQVAETTREGNQYENVRQTSLQEEPINSYKNEKVVKMNNYQSPSSSNKKVTPSRPNRRISVYEPRNYNDCKRIAEALFRKEVVIITFTLMEELQARRVVDFVTGAIYAIDGDIQRIGDEIFICTPANVDIDSSVAQSLVSTHLPNE